ncbi:MAG: Type IV secretory pathway VirB4 component-like protein [Microgenomates group bacterium GW2011_GWB1_44_8]|nr:MAG: Type IV secretory pathway VirB4 component-like protein [Microgenomates group bacterium GW2011_GWB1_44_8]
MPNQISVQNNSSAQPLAEPQPVPATATPIPKADAQILGKGITSVKDIIAPSAIEVDFNHIKITNTFFRTLFVAGYPRFVAANWLSPLINFDRSLQISMFIYPVEGKSVLDDLRRKIAEMEAETASDIQRGRVVDPAVQAKLEDAYSLQEQLVKGIERFFQFSLYVTISATSVEELDQISRQVTSTLGSLLIVSKSASLQMEDAFKSTLPTCTDLLMITRNMDTTSLATTFPFTSSELTANEGILYGINEHNGSLIIFDRFTLENANSVIFAKAGAGKSYLVKLEALRYLLFGAEIIVIDPESEYKILAQAVGGEFINFGFNSPHRINPFDLSMLFEEGENELGNKILSLHTLFKIIMGNLNPSEEAALDRALVMAYKMKGITPDPDTQKNEPPLMEDLYKAFLGMEEPDAKALAQRIEKFVKGSFVGIFDRPSNVDIQNKFTVFSLRDVEETLRPIAMYIILDYVWTKIRRDLKKRLLVVDEAWYLMRYPDAAHFLHGIAKRARKYYLGLSTITQDVEDFLSIDQGKAIITNSSIQILMKQSTAAIDRLGEVFFLSEGEKHLLLAADVGEGLFFAGPNHVAMKVVASPAEHQLITTNPEELLQRQTPKTPSIEHEKQAPAPPEFAKPAFKVSIQEDQPIIPGSGVTPQVNQAESFTFTPEPFPSTNQPKADFPPSVPTQTPFSSSSSVAPSYPRPPIRTVVEPASPDINRDEPASPAKRDGQVYPKTS